MSSDPAGQILVVDDEPQLLSLFTRWLTAEGYAVEGASNAEDAIEALSRSLPDAVCLDIGLPGMSGIDALELIRSRHPRLPVLMMTADREVETVVTAMQRGAYDYLAKPLDRTKFLTIVRNAVERHRMSVRITQLEREAKGAGFASILGRSKVMLALFRQLDRVAVSDVTVLIRGESGTGKELVARALHDNSGRRAGPFVAINCAAVPEALQESEFFGHEKGSFTGATGQRKGRFELADGGTLFLDEVAELSLGLQAKLLRVLQERRFQRVGGASDIRSDFRLVTATHRDLHEEVRAGRFREDLLFRIAVFEVQLPPLRDRDDDLLLLAGGFIERFAPGRNIALTNEAEAALTAHPFPGNVRELENAIQRAIVVCQDGVIDVGDLPAKLRERATPAPPGARMPTDEPPSTRLDEIERRAFEDAHARASGNISEMGRQLGIGRTTVYRMLKKYGPR